MKDVIVTIDDAANMVDADGKIMMNITGMNYRFKKVKKQADIEKLVSLGVSPDDLVKMKANDLI